MNLRSVSFAGYFIVVVALVGLFWEGCLLGSGPISLSVQTLAVVLMVWARVTFGKRSFHAGADATEGGLVTTGPYALIRHPIYASILYFLWAGVCSHPAVESFLLGLLATAGILLRIIAEERLLVTRYAEYEAYAAVTKRLIPFLL